MNRTEDRWAWNLVRIGIRKSAVSYIVKITGCSLQEARSYVRQLATKKL